jgi:hypothetical protein
MIVNCKLSLLYQLLETRKAWHLAHFKIYQRNPWGRSKSWFSFQSILLKVEFIEETVLHSQIMIHNEKRRKKKEFIYCIYFDFYISLLNNFIIIYNNESRYIILSRKTKTSTIRKHLLACPLKIVKPVFLLLVVFIYTLIGLFWSVIWSTLSVIPIFSCLYGLSQ